jgi:hypothetical protein
MFRTMMQTRINAYFSLPPEQRQAELDRQIKQEELFRKAWESSRPAGGGFAAAGGPPGAAATGAGGGPGAPAASGGSGGAAGGAGASGSGNTAGAGNPAGGGPPSGPPRSGNEEDRNRWRKNMIDSTSPEQRARYVEYRRAMEVRREQLGLQPGGPR